MHFIHIATLSDSKNFVSWLESNARKAFNDSTEFSEWLEGQNIFPLEFYLNGITYRFANKRELDFFKIGFEAALNGIS